MTKTYPVDPADPNAPVPTDPTPPADPDTDGEETGTEKAPA